MFLSEKRCSACCTLPSCCCICCVGERALQRCPQAACLPQHCTEAIRHTLPSTLGACSAYHRCCSAGWRMPLPLHPALMDTRPLPLALLLISRKPLLLPCSHAPHPIPPTPPRCRPTVLRPHRSDFATFNHRGSLLAQLPHIRQLDDLGKATSGRLQIS